MGACMISMKLDGKLTPEKAKAAVNEVIRETADEHRYEDAGYSGTWNTINTVSVRTTVYASEQDAENKLSDHIEKRAAVIVRIKDTEAGLKKSKMYQRIGAQIMELNKQLYDRTLTTRKRTSIDKKLAEAYAKRNEILVKIAEKTAKEYWYVMGWAAE
jgi:hypothetical protein